MTIEEQKAYNAENYLASVLTWLNEATDRAYATFDKELDKARKEGYKAAADDCFILLAGKDK